MTHIIVFGHSVAQGYWDKEGGWVRRLRTYLDKRYLERKQEEYDKWFFEVYNAGISGEDTLELRERFKEELEPRLRDSKDIIILHTGLNDIHQLPSGEYRVSEEEFRSAFTELLLEAKEEVENVLVIGEGYIGERKYSPGSKKKISDARLQRFEEIKENLCSKEDIPYIDMRANYSREKWVKKLEDGYHPSDEGHKAIFHQVKNVLEDEELI